MTTAEMLEGKDLYTAEFDRRAPQWAGGAQWLSELRRRAISRFGELGFPTRTDEQWRQTSVARLVKTPFKLAEPAVLGEAERARLESYVFAGFEGVRLVFINGRFCPEESVFEDLPPGVRICSLAEALVTDPELVREHLGRHADFKDHAFAALNTAFIEDGAFVYLPAGATLPHPIHLRFITDDADEPVVTHPRSLIIAGEAARLTIIETYLGLSDAIYFTNAVTEIIVADRAIVDHYKLQRENLNAFHMATLHTDLGGGSHFTNHAITFGGDISRNDIIAQFGAVDSECVLNGLYVLGGTQLCDTHLKLEHAKPHCRSRELYKGVLDGSSTGIFNGYIHVWPDAQKTDAIQSNRALLLSPDATMNAQPQLEIYADDVRCTHGATVGQLSDDATFYLRSRGIPHDEARQMLTFAFANEIIDEIKIDAVRHHLEHLILERFRQSEA